MSFSFQRLSAIAVMGLSLLFGLVKAGGVGMVTSAAFDDANSTFTSDSRVRRALADLAARTDATTEEQVRITEIPAPPFHESVRGAYMTKLLSGAGLAVHVDDLGNVIGERTGASDDIVMIVAHLDTVFRPDVDVHVRRDAGRIYAPGISDNGTGLASMVAIARTVRDAGLSTRATMLFVADVGEEGEGNLRGMRRVVETYRSRLRNVIVLDGSSTDFVATAALPSRLYEITVTGPGGHSWSDFGAPNPIHAMARAIARFVDTPVPQNPRTTFNVGGIEGGMSVNSIPDKALMRVDLRSESEQELGKLAATLQDTVKAGVKEEMAWAQNRRMLEGRTLSITTKLMGTRPGGELAKDSPLLAALRSADKYIGNRSRVISSSTDANIPLSLGIPAIALGAGGRSAGEHSLGEWYDPGGRERGLQRILLTLLQVAGLRN
jgi:acetylornithine deacetylase/succinyl-diaminopimelate desuccinylase-like protein